MTNFDRCYQVKLLPAHHLTTQDLFAIYAITMRPSIEPDFGWDEDFQRERFTKAYPKESFQCIIYQTDMSGLVCLQNKEDHLHLSLLLVLPNFRRKGIASCTLRTVVAQADISHMGVSLSVLENNKAAVSLYTSFGFKITSIEKPFLVMKRQSQSVLDELS